MIKPRPNFPINIAQLQNCIKTEKYEISLHAHKERCNEEIAIADIEKAVLQGEIIEHYPEDKRGASCLISGYSNKRAIHIVCTLLPDQWMRIITVYLPDKHKWVNPKQRRR